MAAAGGGINWPEQVKRDGALFQVLSAHKFNYTAAVKLECEELDLCPPKAYCLLYYIHPAQHFCCTSSLLTRWPADICSRQLLSLLISSSPPKKSARISASIFIWHNGLEYIIREVGGERARRGSFSSVLTTIVWCLVSLLAGRGQQRSSGYLQPSVSRCTVPLCYIKSQIEMTWPVYLVGGIQCVCRPAVAGR